MTVYFDCRFIRPNAMDGVTRFSTELFAELSKIRQITAIISDERQLSYLPGGANYIRASEPTSIREFTLSRRLNRLGATLVFSPMQTTSSLGRRYKLISTLHDLIYYTKRTPPRFLPPALRFGWRLFHLTFWPQRLLLRGSDALVTVSQTSANLIRDARLWPNSKPLEIISPAIDRSIFKPNQVGGRAEHPLSPKSLVYSGSYMPYKGVSTIAAALSQLAEFELHLVSKASEEEQIKIRRAAGSAANRVFFHGGLSDEAYAQLLRESFAMVSASADEGFGIPLIEAMASGLPVVCSDIKIFHEVTGGVAVFFDPNDTNDLVAALQGLEDTTIKSLRSQSIENSKRFDWSGSAKKLDALIERLLTSP